MLLPKLVGSGGIVLVESAEDETEDGFKCEEGRLQVYMAMRERKLQP